MRRLTLLATATILFLVPIEPALAAPGDLVSSFGGDGVVTESVQQTIRDGSDVYLGGFAMDGAFSVAAFALYSLT